MRPLRDDLAADRIPVGGFVVIYADPPWDFRVWSRAGAGRTAASHYRTMTTADLQRLDVLSIAADDCALFLWSTCPNLTEAIDTMRAWGFDYKTVAFSWSKTARIDQSRWHIGMGYWTRANVELCLLGTRGRPRRVSRSVRQLVVAPVQRHSEKPREIYARIEMLMGDVSRIELFARSAPPDGWVATGIEYDGRDVRDAIEQIAHIRRASITKDAI